VTELVREVAGDAQPEGEHREQHEVELKAYAHVLFSLRRTIYTSVGGHTGAIALVTNITLRIEIIPTWRK